MEYILKGLSWYFPPVNSLSKQKRAMRRCTKNPRSLNVRRYSTRLIDLNGYLASYTGATMSEKRCVTELNENLLNSISNSWSKQEYVQGFDCEKISLKKDVNMFERM